MPTTDSLVRQAVASKVRFRWPQIYFGVAATSLATLLLELSLTRVFSVIYYYHFAFLAISIALFGLGAGGVMSYIVAGWPGSLFRKIGLLAGVNAIATVAILWFLLTQTGQMTTAYLIAAYFTSAIPFLLSGTIVSLVVAETIQRVDRVYFFDLMGAAAGCAVLVKLLNWVGGPNTIVVTAVVFAVTGAIWFHLAGSARGRIVCVALGLALVALIAWNSKQRLLDIRFAKHARVEGEEYVAWNSFSRIALKNEGNMKSIVIDADAATGVADFDFHHLTERERFDLKYAGPGFPYILRPGAKTLVIGPGGGWDVSRALASGSSDVTGVEINPIIARTIMQEKFPQYSNYLYSNPAVHIEIEDGRTFVRRSSERYQVLQATLVDTWASTAAGAFALSENNLYTSEAFTEYLRHLTTDGVMSFTRWGFAPPRESLRVVSLAIAALHNIGQDDPANHVIIVREHLQQLNKWGAQDTILISRSPFSASDIENAVRAAAVAHMEVLYVPGTSTDSPFRALLTAQKRERFFDKYVFDVRPVSDDAPFFFYTVQPRDLWAFFWSASKSAADYKVNLAIPLLFGLVAISLLATGVILALPPVLLGSRLPRAPGALRALLFFLFIGAGYILIQVALIQKFVLFLGHPTYALTVIIFSMLISSGAGSFASRRLMQRNAARLQAILLIVCGGVAILASVVSPIVEGGVALPFAVRVLITVLVIAPVGFAMGMPFPTGLGLLERLTPESVRWAWAVNAASSVMGSAAAMFFAIYIGLRMTLILGAICYGLAWLFVRISMLSRGASVPAPLR